MKIAKYFTSILNAAREGDIEVLIYLQNEQNEHVCLDEINPNTQMSTIEYLASKNELFAVNILLKAGVSPKRAVLGAAMAGNLKFIKEYTKNGDYRDLAVEGAAKGGKFKIVRELIENGADISFAARGAAQGGHSELVRELIKNGANKNFAVQGAAQGGHFEFVTELIIKAKASITKAIEGAARGNHRTFVKSHMDKVHDGVNCAVKGAAAGGYVQYVLQLICQKGDIVGDAIEGAAYGGHFKLVGLLLNPYTSNHLAVEAAASGGHFKLVDYLLKNNADINFAVIGATDGEHSMFVNQLIESGANKDLAIERAGLFGHFVILNQLMITVPNINLAAGYTVEMGSFKTEEKSLFFLANINDEKIRNKFAELTDIQQPDHKFKLKDLLPQAKQISSDKETYGITYALAKKFSTHPGLCYWLLRGRRSKWLGDGNKKIPKDVWLLIAEAVADFTIKRFDLGLLEESLAPYIAPYIKKIKAKKIKSNNVSDIGFFTGFGPYSSNSKITDDVLTLESTETNDMKNEGTEPKAKHAKFNSNLSP